MKVELLCSWGGHLQEMLEIQEAWSRYDHEIITYESERARAMSDTEPMLIVYPSEKLAKFTSEKRLQPLFRRMAFRKSIT